MNCKLVSQLKPKSKVQKKKNLVFLTTTDRACFRRRGGIMSQILFVAKHEIEHCVELKKKESCRNVFGQSFTL
jgi:hypothetical protein